jgi:hypothetical protein
MIKNLRPNWTCKAIEYTGQPIDQLNAEIAQIKTIKPIVASFRGGDLYLDSAFCCDTPIEIGDWILFEPGQDDSYYPDVLMGEAVGKYYKLVDR